MERDDRQLENKEARATKGINNLKRKLKKRKLKNRETSVGDNLIKSSEAMANLAGDNLKVSLQACASEGELEVGNKLEKEAMALPTVEKEIRRLKDEAMALMKPTAAEADEPVEPSKKRKKFIKQRLSQAFIEHFMATPFKPIHLIPKDKVAKRSQRYREWYATQKAIADKILEYQQALIKMYVTKGYAENEIEVTDDEEN